MHARPGCMQCYHNGIFFFRDKFLGALRPRLAILVYQATLGKTSAARWRGAEIYFACPAQNSLVWFLWRGDDQAAPGVRGYCGAHVNTTHPAYDPTIFGRQRET